MTGWVQSFHSLSFLRANVLVDVINGCKQRAQSSLHNAMSYLFLRVHCELQPRCLLRCILNAFLQITKDNCRKSIRPSLYDHGSRLICPDLKDSSEVPESLGTNRSSLYNFYFVTISRRTQEEFLWSRKEFVAANINLVDNKLLWLRCTLAKSGCSSD